MKLIHKKSLHLQRMNERNNISAFSDYLFWDVPKENIDLDAHAPYIVQRVLELGRMEDWELLVSIYGIKRIAETTKKLRTLEPKALSFISLISHTPKEEFRCYTTKPSFPDFGCS